MVSVLPGSLSKNDEAVVRKLFKVIRATKFEDPVDQDAFLVESANTVVSIALKLCCLALLTFLFIAPIPPSSRLLRAGR
jgi:hypothetical protein